ncbi:MAG: DUF4125 family protein [Oscillospiraceae bacterium]|nr:DUF4125 family protein [Oscillospiraceae bacterium]
MDFIGEIISAEWRLMEQASPHRGCVPCHQDGFRSMRVSQLMAWNQRMLKSYYQDLLEAEAEGRNPIGERAGYLLERTSSEAYEQVKDTLPERSLEKDYLLDWICQAQAVWQEELAKQYPRLVCRPIRRSEEGSVSFETCLWAELTSCSVPTLRLYAAYVEELQQTGVNLNRIILLNLAAEYGWDSLEEAEQHLSERQSAVPLKTIKQNKFHKTQFVKL